jgi:hypothetical protein
MKRIIALIISVLIHLVIIFFILSYFSNKNSQIKPKDNLVEVTFVTKPKTYEEKLLTIRKEQSKQFNKQEKTKFIEKCDNKHSYIGIGIQFFPDGRISDVAKGYAADRAGLKVGDRIIDSMNYHRVGDYEYISVIRNFRKITFKIKVERICIKEP